VTAVTPDLTFQVANGFMAAKHLFVANEVGLFKALGAAPATLDALAHRMTIPRRTLRILADAMVALGFLERQGDQYQNTPVSSAFLSGRTPTDLRPALRYWNHLSYQRWAQLEAVVRAEQAVFEEFAFTPEEQQLYTEGVDAITAGTARALATTYEFARHRRVLDLGGGTGSFLLAVLRQHPHVEATLFDAPAVAALARQRLAGSPVATRLRIAEGDFFADPLPLEGYQGRVHLRTEIKGRSAPGGVHGGRDTSIWYGRARDRDLVPKIAAGGDVGVCPRTAHRLARERAFQLVVCHRDNREGRGLTASVTTLMQRWGGLLFPSSSGIVAAFLAGVLRQATDASEDGNVGP
jgi:hypothetical protein